MKKLVFIFLFALVASVASAQTGSLISTSNSTAIDTVTNTGARSQVLAIAGPQAVVTIVSTVTEISGTTAGGLELYGSIDGTSYALIDTAASFPVDQAAAQSYAWHVAPSKFAYYKVTYTGAGTMAAKLSSKALWRKEP